MLLLLPTLVGYFHVLETGPLQFSHEITSPLPFNSLGPTVLEKLNQRIEPFNAPCTLPKADGKADVPSVLLGPLLSTLSLCLGQWFSITGDSPSSLFTLCLGHLTMSEVLFNCQSWEDATGI